LELRCHSCSKYLCESTTPVQLAGIFKASLMGRVARAHIDEIRKRCKSCGWVNVFTPAAIDIKQAG